MNNLMKFCVISSITALSLPAVAATDSFEGLAVELGVGLSHNKVKYSGYVDSVSSSDNDTLVHLGLSYNLAIYENFLLGIGATYNLTNNDAGRIYYTDRKGNYTVDAKMKQHFSLYAAPGYKITPDLLVYGKLAYHNAKVEYNDTYPGQGTHSLNTNGFGFGAGVSYQVFANTELGVEIEHVTFQRKHGGLSEGKPSTTTYNLIAKYRF